MTADKRHKQLLITLDDEYLDKAPEVVASLRKAGLTGVKPMESIGIVSGQAPASKVAALRKIRGVRAVEESTWTQLPAPDAPIQ